MNDASVGEPYIGTACRQRARSSLRGLSRGCNCTKKSIDRTIEEETVVFGIVRFLALILPKCFT
jgi:hypothetical protein